MTQVKNRAKCKVCNTIMHAKEPYIRVLCNCGRCFIELEMDKTLCGTDEWSNLVFVDDEGNEIVLNSPEETEVIPEKISKKQLIEQMKDMIRSYDNLPPRALYEPVLTIDMKNLMLLVVGILESEN